MLRGLLVSHQVKISLSVSLVPYRVVDVQWRHLSFLGCPGHVQHSHAEALFLSLMGVGDLHQAIHKVIPPLHKHERNGYNYLCSLRLSEPWHGTTNTHRFLLVGVYAT